MLSVLFLPFVYIYLLKHEEESCDHVGPCASPTFTHFSAHTTSDIAHLLYPSFTEMKLREISSRCRDIYCFESFRLRVYGVCDFVDVRALLCFSFVAKKGGKEWPL